MARRDEPQDPDKNKKSKKRGLGRREFVKLVGGTTFAVSTGALGGAGLLAAGAAAASTSAQGNLLGPAAVPITLRVNGGKKSLRVEPRVTLLDALRDHLDLTGAKRVCDHGTCGACTVLMDGKMVYSCSVLAIDAEGRQVVTVEGLSADGKLHPVQQAFVDNDAQQCGFCTPGFVMACKAFLDQHPHPTLEQIKHGLSGNFCRCGTYAGIRAAVMQAAKATRGA